MPRKSVSLLEPSKESSSNERKEDKIHDDGNSNMPQAAPPPSRGGLGRGFRFMKGKSLRNIAKGMGDLEDSIDDITEEVREMETEPVQEPQIVSEEDDNSIGDITEGFLNSDPSSSKMWDTGMTDDDDDMEEFRREMEMAGSYKPEPEQELRTVSEDDDDNSNVPQAAPPPSRGLDRGFSFIKGKSLRNIAKGMDDFENSIDDITDGFFDSDPSSSKMWESGMTDDDDGMEKLQREMEMTESLPIMEGDGTDVPHTLPAPSSKPSQLETLCAQIRHQEELEELQKRLDETEVERDRLKNWQKEIMQVKEELGPNETDVTLQKLANDITDELYSKRKWISWLYGWIFLALFVIGTLPTGAFMLSSFKRRYSPIVAGHTKSPLKTGTSAKRDTILNSNLQEVLIQARVIIAESHEIMSTFSEDQLIIDTMMNTIVQNLRGIRVDTLLDEISHTTKPVSYAFKNLFKTQESS